MTTTTKKVSVAVMTKERCDAAWNSQCGMFFSADDMPSGCDENGMCLNEWDTECSEYENEKEVCDYCGEELGFCALDCETSSPDFEE